MEGKARTRVRSPLLSHRPVTTNVELYSFRWQIANEVLHVFPLTAHLQFTTILFLELAFCLLIFGKNGRNG